MNLLLAEHDYQVEDFISRGLGAKGEWIALGPSAMWALDKKHISYNIPEDFYNSLNLEATCLKEQERLENLCDKLDEQLWEEHPELKKMRVCPFLFHIFPLTILLDNLVSRIFQLKAIFNAHPGHTAWVHCGAHRPWDAFDICFSNEETLWGHVLSLPGWKCGTKILEDPPKGIFTANSNINHDRDGYYPHLKQKVDRWIKSSVFLYTAAHSIAHRDFKAVFDLLIPGKKNSLLINGGTYEWSYAIPALRAQGWRILFASNLLFKDKWSNNHATSKSLYYDTEETRKEMNDYFQSEGVRFYPLLEDRFTWIRTNAPRLCLRIASRLDDTIQKYKIQAILCATNPTFRGHVINQASRFYCLPVIKWQQGFIMYYKDRISQLNQFGDLMTADAVLTFGKETERAYSFYRSKFPAVVTAVGSASIDKVRESNHNCSPAPIDRSTTSISKFQARNKLVWTIGAGSDEKGKVNLKTRILYATTNYYQNTWYCGFSPPFSDRLFYRDQSLIIKSLQEIAMSRQFGCEVTFKLSPGKTCQDPPWVDEISNLKVVKDSQSFVELLQCHDVIIIDCPTTTLLQAIATGLPVFVLMRHWTYPQHALQMLTNRAVVADNIQNLIDALQKYLIDGTYPARIEDNSFLRAYGNFRDDGNSITRVVKTIEGLLNGQSQLKNGHIPHNTNI
jgi:hypothetical protein